MRPGLHEAVDVLSIYSKNKKIFKPALLTWNKVDYRLGKIDFYHKTKKGATTLHHFSMADKDETLYVKLTFNSASLNWTLDEYQFAGNSELSYTT